LHLEVERVVSVWIAVACRMRAVVPMVDGIPFGRAMRVILESAGIANAVIVNLAAIGVPFGDVRVVRATFRTSLQIRVWHIGPFLDGGSLCL